MSMTADIDSPPHDQAPNPPLDATAAASLNALLEARPTFAADLEEAGRAHTHLAQEWQRETDAQDALTRAEQHASGMIARVNLTGRRFAGFTVGVLAVALLLVFDAIPLNWAAQAFGLAAATTWLVTGIMLVASAGAMAGIELTREDSRRRAALLVLMAAGYTALTVLRTAFLVTVAGESLGAAVLQAVLLSAISAGLVGCGSVVMARTRSLALARAMGAVKRARRTAAACHDARRRAEERMQLHWAVLQRVVREWSIMSQPPAGASHAEWISALEQAMRALLPAQ